MHRGRLRSPCRSTAVSGPAPRLSGRRRRRRAVWSQRSSLPARRAQRAVPQLRRPAAPALKSLQRSSGVSSLSPSSSPVSALDARVTLKATGISYLVATCSRTTTSPLPVFPTPVVSCFPQSAPGSCRSCDWSAQWLFTALPPRRSPKAGNSALLPQRPNHAVDPEILALKETQPGEVAAPRLRGSGDDRPAVAVDLRLVLAVQRAEAAQRAPGCGSEPATARAEARRPSRARCRKSGNSP